jgi:uncharacterized protein
MTNQMLETNDRFKPGGIRQQRALAQSLRDVAPGMSGLDYLLKLYEENFALLRQLLGAVRDYSGANLSHVPGKPPLWLEIIEQQPYTTIARLTHSFNAAKGIVLDPNAYVRIYHDTRQVEATHCHIGAHLKKIYSLDVPLHEVNQKRLRMTVFLNKWLRYLLDTGHQPSSFEAVDALPKAPSSPILAPEHLLR